MLATAMVATALMATTRRCCGELAAVVCSPRRSGRTGWAVVESGEVEEERLAAAAGRPRAAFLVVSCQSKGTCNLEASKAGWPGPGQG